MCMRYKTQRAYCIMIALNEYFTSVFTVDADFEGCATLENVIESIYFTPKYILMLIDKLNCSKAAGPDRIHS